MTVEWPAHDSLVGREARNLDLDSIMVPSLWPEQLTKGTAYRLSVKGVRSKSQIRNAQGTPQDSGRILNDES